ncbi:Acetyl esterase/lipase [Microbacterium sp. cf046]|uniref:alpha/beta hydrolase n=1 Tax=Microbacterium sp. cf046 TaxID=1761803 RepID=UPI0008F39894|nr:alpha/beta hydrolase [Microbacterium sp. cf046]SFS17644.1 Acetyl esterase/lipase [Microbacterium sp. cf046]
MHDESGAGADAGDSPGAGRTRRRRRLLISLGVVIGIVLIVAVVTSITPWPSAMVIRAVFQQGGAAAAAEMTPYVPEKPLRELDAVQYADGGEATTLDVFTPADEGERRPTVVWIHGGAWISGSTANIDPYLRILAAEGYTTIGVNYSVGPEATYPTAVTQLNEALAFIQENAEEFSVDTSQIVLAGDSAGAQLASQLATLITSPRYAHLVGIEPSLDAEQVVGMILNCGVYDLRAMAELTGLPAWGFKVALWAYTGTKDWSEQPAGATMSTIEFVTEDFPPTYISGGNGDGLTWLQSIPMAQRLDELGVPVTELFWPAPHEPQLPHEYQFHLDMPEAQEALTATIDWLGANTTLEDRTP